MIPFIEGVGDLVGARAESPRFDLRWWLGDSTLGLGFSGKRDSCRHYGIAEFAATTRNCYCLLYKHWKLWYNGSHCHDRGNRSWEFSTGVLSNWELSHI